MKTSRRSTSAPRLAHAPSAPRVRSSTSPPRLTPSRERKLRKILLRGAAAYGFASDLWSYPRIARVIRREFGIRLSASAIPSAIHSVMWA